MAIVSGFFNSVNGDRKYDTNDISSLFTGIFADGVFKTVGNNFMVKASSGMEVTIDTGKAWFDKHFVENTALLPKTIDQSEVLLDRIDAYAIEIDNTEPVRIGTLVYVKGTPASDPQKPELVKTEKKTQYPIAYITVSHGATSITDANIEIMVGKSECPFAVGVIEGIDIDNLFVQWEAQFGEWMTNEQLLFAAWFENIKGQLSEDAAGNLQVQIDSYRGAKEILVTNMDWYEGKQTVELNGILSTDVPVIGPKYSSTDNHDTKLMISREFGKILSASPENNYITFYLKNDVDVPLIDLTLLVKI